ncbi:hypothetical protein PROFUN_05676 [Planoprotostelium fungivorum]|uniref:non-specific serine/threonine protein kinase n=1 Tax=Planoprotostelium fungivorum TaxID=1890364 RepID=A0A2P6NQC8_9EUKA|nr:hypothetical protein PROFUN_09678 [Planoprotostelium fungivorum]PRP86160.1 hypothetical protein PROFUN_05676 [Planoprotostelium fungivorum]
MTALYTTKDGQIKMATGTDELFGFSADELTDKSWDVILSAPYKEHNQAHPGYLETQFQPKDGQPSVDSFEVTQEGQKRDNDESFAIRINISKLTPGDVDSMIQVLIDEYKETSVTLGLDWNGSIKNCSKQIEEFFGYEPDAVKGETLDLLFPPSFQAKGQKPILDPTETSVIIRSLVGQHKKGEKFFCTLELRPVKVADRFLYHGLITKLDPSVEALVILDDTETILSYSQTFFLTLFGYKRGELQGTRMASIIKRKRPPREHGRGTRKRKQDGTDNGNSDTPRHKSRKSRGENGAQEVQQPPTTPTAQKDGNIASPTTPSPAAPAEVTEAPSTNGHAGSPTTPTPAAAAAPAASADPEYTKDDSGLVHILHKDGSEVPIHLEVFPFKTPEGKWRFSMKIKRVPLKKEKILYSKAVGNYLLGEVLGEGTGGKVKKGIHTKTREPVAIKMIQKKKMDQDSIERTKREITIMGKLDHQNIIKLHDVIDSPKKLYIVMELIDGDGDLMKYISIHGPIVEKETHGFFKQILSAVNYCHSAGVIHRDLKHNNIMINREGKIKLIDFGTSNFLSDGKLAETFCGTPRYAAPEMMLGQKYDGTLVDTWSLGVVFYTMLTAKFPFEAVADLLVGTYEEPTGVSAECLQFLSLMLVVKPEDRAHIPTLMAHPWITQGN